MAMLQPGFGAAAQRESTCSREPVNPKEADMTTTLNAPPRRTRPHSESVFPVAPSPHPLTLSQPPAAPGRSCLHVPACPTASDPDRDGAVVVADHLEQGWQLLCNGVVHFDDGIDLLPRGVRAAGGPPFVVAAK
jgi:hypothetical protein